MTNGILINISRGSDKNKFYLGIYTEKLWVGTHLEIWRLCRAAYRRPEREEIVKRGWTQLSSEHLAGWEDE